jgi:hypothetical protein
MFNILKYSHDAASGIYEITVAYQLKHNGEIINDGGTFHTRQSADVWMYQIKKVYFVSRLKSYIRHKQHIIDAAMKGHKSLSIKKAILDELIGLIPKAVDQATPNDAYRWALIMNRKLEQILPSDSNKSYHSSRDELKLITSFAQAQLQLYK